MDDPQPVDDDLEYYVTFPAPLPDTEKFIEELKGLLKEPVVVLIGWANSSDKDLAAFSSVYDQRGCITVRIPLGDVPKDPAGQAALAEKVLELLLDMNLEDNQIVFHAFGNASCSVLLHAMHKLHSGDGFSELKVAGVVYDSAPSRNVEGALLAPSSSLWRVMWRGVVGMAHWLFALAHYALGFVSRVPTSVYDQLKEGPWRWPELYLYSEADGITLYSDVDEIVAHRQKIGVHVDAFCWNDTTHLRHLDGHGKAYEELCVRFINKCCSAVSSDGDCAG